VIDAHSARVERCASRRFVSVRYFSAWKARGKGSVGRRAA